MPDDPDKDQIAFWGRIGSLASGFALVGLGAIDAVLILFLAQKPHYLQQG